MQTVKINLNKAKSSQYVRMKIQTVAESLLAVFLYIQPSNSVDREVAQWFYTRYENHIHH